MRRLRTLLGLIPICTCAAAGVQLLSGRPAAAPLRVERSAVPLPAASLPAEALTPVAPAAPAPRLAVRPVRTPGPPALTRSSGSRTNYGAVHPPVLPPATVAARAALPAAAVITHVPAQSTRPPHAAEAPHAAKPVAGDPDPAAAAPPAPVPDAARVNPEGTPAEAIAAEDTALSQQCQGTTRSGARCRRKTRDASGFCYQHRSQASP
jgi:hypothetical protein